MFEMWAVSVDDGNGKEKYGADYSDIWAINRLHFKAASPLECDHVRCTCRVAPFATGRTKPTPSAKLDVVLQYG